MSFFPYRIQVADRIAPEGLALLPSPVFALSAEESDPHAILVRSTELDTDLFPSLLAVGRAGAGVNNITVDKATARGIAVFNTPGANANAVAEIVFVMLGMWFRNIHQSVEFCRGLGAAGDLEREVERTKARFRGVELAGKSLGVLGLGKIGVRVAGLGVHHRMRVLGFDPSPSIENIHALAPEVLLLKSVDEVLTQADVLSLHMPLVPETCGMVNREFFGRMRPGCVLVNYARGELVDVKALAEALDSGHLVGYLADFPAAELLKHPRVLFTPHLGASTEESEENCARMAAEELGAYLRYGIVSRSVNFPTAESIPAARVRCRFIMINHDVPDMIGFASHAIGSRGINIAGYINASNGKLGYNIIDSEQEMDDGLVAAIAAHPGVIRTRLIAF